MSHPLRFFLRHNDHGRDALDLASLADDAHRDSHLAFRLDEFLDLRRAASSMALVVSLAEASCSIARLGMVRAAAV